MDPQAAWERMLRAFQDGDWDELETHAIALRDWLTGGGFVPTVISSDDVHVVCLMALDVIRLHRNRRRRKRRGP